jgi:ABC-type uncharacterized transport system auxiliary subunit
MTNPAKVLVTLAVLAASITLGGCFHHQQTYTAEVLPPPSAPPLK